MAAIAKIAVWLEQNWRTTLDVAAPIFLSIYAIWVGYWLPEVSRTAPSGDSLVLTKFWFSKTTIWIGLILVLVNIVSGFLTKTEISRLRRDNTELERDFNELEEKFHETSSKREEAEQALADLRSDVETWIYEETSSFLKSIGKALDFSDKDRISLYLHTGDCFILCGRYSEHPENNKKNRVRFPLRQGCIWRAWTDTGYHSVNLPDPAKANDAYREKLLGTYGYTSEEIEALRMHSCYFSAKAISLDGRRGGVVVIESNLMNRFSDGQVTQCIEERAEFMSELLRRTRLVSSLALQGEG